MGRLSVQLVVVHTRRIGVKLDTLATLALINIRLLPPLCRTSQTPPSPTNAFRQCQFRQGTVPRFGISGRIIQVGRIEVECFEDCGRGGMGDLVPLFLRLSWQISKLTSVLRLIAVLIVRKLLDTLEDTFLSPHRRKL